MTTLTLKEFLQVSAEEEAARLSHWQVLDIVFVHRNGRIQVAAKTPPCRPLAQLVALGILKRSDTNNTSNALLIPAHRFRPVLECLWRSGRVKRPEDAA